MQFQLATSACRSLKKPNRRLKVTPNSRPSARLMVRDFQRWRMTQALKLSALAERPVFIPRAGQVLAGTSGWRCRKLAKKSPRATAGLRQGRKRISSPCCASPGPTAERIFSRAKYTVISFGRREAATALATIRCLLRTAKRRLTAKWSPRKNMRTRIARGHSRSSKPSAWRMLTRQTLADRVRRSQAVISRR